MLGENIRNLRKQKGYTQETFARELNVVRQTVSKWEKGYSVPDAVMLEKISGLLEVPVGELLGSDAEKKEDGLSLTQIAEQLYDLNQRLEKEAAKKRKRKRAAIAVIAVLLAGICLLCAFVLFPSREVPHIENESNVVVTAHISDELDAAVSEAILAQHNPDNPRGECRTQSHLVFGTEEKGDTVTVYLLADYEEYGFVNGFFIGVSGSSVPSVFTFRKNAEGYQLIKTEHAEDGSRYGPSLKALFPQKIEKKILAGLTKAENEQMWIAVAKQAQDYLDTVGRQATICSYGDMETVFLTDYGVETELENRMIDMFPAYDSTIGNHEVIENGRRYVYQTEYDVQNGWITFTKFEYDTLNIAEFTAVNGQSGEIVKNAPRPENAVYRMGKLVSAAEQSGRFTTVVRYH